MVIDRPRQPGRAELLHRHAGRPGPRADGGPLRLRSAHWAAGRSDELHFLAGYDHGGFAAESVVQRIILDERYQPKPPAPGSMTADWAILILKHRFALKPILLFDESSLRRH